MTKKKKRRGDRRDGTLIRNIDPMHYITAVVTPGRCNNEAYISETIDLTNINAYLAKKNAAGDDFKYTMFHVVVAAFLKVLRQREKMNRFIINDGVYQRDFVSAAFVVKKKFSDNGGEGLAVVYANEDDTIDTIHDQIRKVVYRERREVAQKGDNGTNDAMDMFSSLPRWLSRLALHAIIWMDKHDMVPMSMLGEEPYHHSLVVSNVGSIGLHTGYHHLTEFGTNSVFCLIGEKYQKPFYDEEGKATMREVVDLGITIDERLADGYYYARSIKLLKYLLEHPETLDDAMKTEVEYDAK